MRVVTSLVSLALLAVAGCAHSGSPSVRARGAETRTARAEEAPPCMAIVPGADLFGWREVATDGVTFCVPRSWHGSGRTWWHGATTLEWGRGMPRATSGRASAGMVLASVGAMSRASQMSVSSLEARDANVVATMDQFSETIGGFTATVVRMRSDLAVQTAARWSDLQLFALGSAPDMRGADVLLLVFRTMRKVDRE